MSKFYVYANGTLWGQFEANSAQEAIQKAADTHGTIDVNQTRASTDGLTAQPAEPWSPVFHPNCSGCYAVQRDETNEYELDRGGLVANYPMLGDAQRAADFLNSREARS